MHAILIAAAALTALSLAGGLSARARLVRHPAAGVTAVTAAGLESWRSFSAAMLRQDRRLAALALWLMVLDTALALAAPWPVQLVVDYGLGGRRLPGWLTVLNGWGPVALAFAAAVSGLVLLAAGALAGYLVTYLSGALGERMALRLRTGLAGHLTEVAPRTAAGYPLGELASRLGADVRQVCDAIGAVLENVVPDLALLTGMTVITAVLDWRLTLLTLGLIPLYALTARRRNRSLRGAQRRARARSGELAALTADQLGRLPAMHVFGQGRAETARYATAAALAAEAAVAALDASARFRPVSDLLPGVGLGAALVAGTTEVAAGRLTIGGLLVFVAYLSSLTGPVRSLAGLSTALTRGAASKDRVTELLRLPALAQVTAARAARPAARATRPAARRGAAPRGGAEVIARDLRFAHRDGEPVLDGASLWLPSGTLTCLTGPSGAGKSTLLSLLTRLAEPRSGRIMIDGSDIRELPLAELRALVSLVPQDPWLHAGTIAENIAYGRPDASRIQIAGAAERAGADAFVLDLADGYDTQVGEHGKLLSVGQRRRVAIARALLREPSVLLLDEPTAGLDAVTEAGVADQLLAGTAGTTVLLVTHNLQLAGLADQVVRLESGQLRPASAGWSRAASLAGCPA